MKKYLFLILALFYLNEHLFSEKLAAPGLINTKDLIIGRFHLKRYCSRISSLSSDKKSKARANNNHMTHPDLNSINNPLKESASINKSKSQKKTGRALLESFAFMAVSAGLYWWRWGLWAEDWQYSFSWEDQRNRFFTLEATKFDSNSFMTNFSHGPNGAIFYNFARTNHLTVSESWFFAISTSLFWEYLVEYKEIVSINDNLFNSFLGFSMGEPLFQLGKYLSYREETVCKVLAAIVNPVLALNNWLSGNNRFRDNNLLSRSRLESHLLFGVIHGEFSGTDPGYNHFNTGIRSSLISIPDYSVPGETHMKLKGPFFSEIFADMNIGPKYIEEFNIITKATLFGYFKKNLKENRDRLEGFQFYLALGSAFDMFRKTSKAPYDTITSGSSTSEHIAVTRPTDFSDKMAIINTLGPMIEFSLFKGRTIFTLNIEAYFDFALVNSIALSSYSVENQLYSIKSTLSKYGYYYALGFTTLVSMKVRRGNLNLDSLIKYHQFDSIDGLDRFQDSIVDDFNLIDSRLLFQISLGYRIPQTYVTLLLSYQSIDREGTIKDIHHQEIEKKIFFQIKLDLI
jgi:hypothetical protein